MPLDTASYPLPVARSVADIRDSIAEARRAGKRVALVPTMGALHEGHLALVRLAAQYAEHVVVSIFVNPAQFAPHEDFDAYPRSEGSDAAKLALEPCAVIYAPSAAQMYPEGFATRISLSGPAEGLESDFRPHFFGGVATVVAKLLLQVLPDAALFGEKDFQQLQVIRRMVLDLNIPTEIIGGETVREADGLALSSRNVYLSTDERSRAAELSRTLHDMAAAIMGGADIASERAKGLERLSRAGFEPINYLEVRDAVSLTPIAAYEPSRPARILAAAWLGKTRLIDNVPLGE